MTTMAALELDADKDRLFPLPGEYPCGLAWDGESFWHSDQRAGQIFRMDGSSGAVRGAFSCRSARADLTYREGLLYQIGMRPKRLLVISRETGARQGVKRIEPSNGRVTGVDVHPDGFVMCLRGPSVIQVRDFESMSVCQEIPIEGSVSGLAVYDDYALVGDFPGRCMRGYHLPSGGLACQVDLIGSPTGLCAAGDTIWYADFHGRSLRALKVRGSGKRRGSEKEA
jgi:hypothetical protein